MRVNRDIFQRTLCLVLAFGIFTSEGAGFGDVVLAGNAILLQFQSFVSYGLDGFAHAAEILAGSARGARNRRTFRAAALACSRSEEHTSELQSLMRISSAVFCLKKKNQKH